MGFRCETILRSRNPLGNILSTLEVSYPRFIHSEILTHRDRERNSGSSRAIPWPTMCERIEQEPVIPIRWGAEQKGMQTGDEIPEELRALATQIWLETRTHAVSGAKRLHEVGKIFNQMYPGKAKPEYEDVKIHKSLCNRLTEPWMWITVVMTSTEWNNFFRQRCHPDAEIHFQTIAGMMRSEIERKDNIQDLKAGEWHLPYFDAHEADSIIIAILNHQLERIPKYVLEYSKRISVARCARVSYVQHGSKVRDVISDAKLWDRLRQGSGLGHWSPFGHIAESSNLPIRSGPFFGFKQFRKEFVDENTPG